MSCSLTCGVSLISSATFSRCTWGNRPPRPRPSPPAAPAPAPPSPSVLTGNGIFCPTEISPSSLFMMRMCGFDSTSTSLLVCSALMSTPNDGMSTVAVAAEPSPAASAGVSTGPRIPASMVSPSALVGCSVLAGLRPADDEARVAEPEQALRLDAVPGGAEVALLVERDLQDHRLDEDLLARRIEQLDHPPQRLVVLERRDDDQRVGGAIEVEAHLPFEQQIRPPTAAGRWRRSVSASASASSCGTRSASASRPRR